MRKLLLGLATVFTGLVLQAQSTALPQVDKSPMDMSYYPNGYPVQKIQDKITEPLVARVIYSRPQKSGRTIFGGLIKYGELWRMGANEATEIEFYKNVRIAGKKISRGRYTLYAIVNENSWTIILNKETDTWGSFKYDIKKDVLRTVVPTQKTDAPVESLSMVFEKTAAGTNLIVAWDAVKVALPINF
ncbi:MAG: DUF2911 domain-containing protein [Bacteroidota bacterium]